MNEKLTQFRAGVHSKNTEIPNDAVVFSECTARPLYPLRDIPTQDRKLARQEVHDAVHTTEHRLVVLRFDQKIAIPHVPYLGDKRVLPQRWEFVTGVRRDSERLMYDRLARRMGGTRYMYMADVICVSDSNVRGEFHLVKNRYGFHLDECHEFLDLRALLPSVSFHAGESPFYGKFVIGGHDFEILDELCLERFLARSNIKVVDEF